MPEQKDRSAARFKSRAGNPALFAGVFMDGKNTVLHQQEIFVSSVLWWQDFFR
jgi:hypothetical protein